MHTDIEVYGVEAMGNPRERIARCGVTSPIGFLRVLFASCAGGCQMKLFSFPRIVCLDVHARARSVLVVLRKLNAMASGN